MWLAHALTLSRLPLAIALVAVRGAPAWAIPVIALAAATDALDGAVARRARRRGATGPDIGAWLDPLVDKLFVAAVLAVLWTRSHDAVLLALIFARELVLVPLVLAYLAQRRPMAHLRAAPVGKAATVAQLVACGVALGAPAWGRPVAAIAAALGLAAVVGYVRRERAAGAPGR